MNYIQIAKTYCCNVVALSTLVLLASCGGGGGGSTTPPPSAPLFGTGALNDSGINASQCYTGGSDVLVPCTDLGATMLNTAQDGMVGRDANVSTNSNSDGRLGFSFTPVTGGCVMDNVTRLTWEVKTTDNGVRDWTKTYTHITAADFVNTVNNSNLCGHSDWRLPMPDELQRIVDYSVAPGPTIDAAWFLNTQAGVFWSGALNKSDSTQAWGVNFQYGSVSPLYFRSETHYVRLVRADF
jgi:hypothetical protein